MIKLEKEFTNAAGDLGSDPFDDPFSVDEETPRASSTGSKSTAKSGKKASINSKLNSLILKHEVFFQLRIFSPMILLTHAIVYEGCLLSRIP